MGEQALGRRWQVAARERSLEGLRAARSTGEKSRLFAALRDDKSLGSSGYRKIQVVLKLSTDDWGRMLSSEG